MSDPHFLRRQADRCYRLARTCFDLDVAAELNRMGDDFMAAARKGRPDLGVIVAASGKGSGHPPNGGIGYG